MEGYQELKELWILKDCKQDTCRDFIQYGKNDTGVEVAETDRVVTLSTCVSSRRDYRYIVHGKLKKVMDNERNIR